MYIPAPFRESDRATLYDFMVAHPLAVLVTAAGPVDAPYATHLPLHLDREGGRLQGHVARANPHVQWLPAGGASVPGLVVFSGVDHYVTPTWYASKQESGRVVPTWNYIAVHVQGAVTRHDDVAWLEAHLAQLTDVHEATQAHPWAMHDAPREYLDAQMRGIVGVSVRIDALEGKYKMSQNRPDADINGVVQGLARLATPAAVATAAEMARRKPAR
ncbi:FMN-binding negative transcriptional regulator [Gemmatimonas sp.]|uniref:FMN-binding negative transcriptional regulator n=1 Tax=Gemmatimonas sp. TaxID=1962908 RepID=UPI0025BE44BC|nr:FMN-binding negative transcriptional regulator [Gemmatimonas sp.]MCA2985261.1 FMN-binding negative transcriptional regulator [Gemmatimonas sp.]MCA2990590.1 FMN-binding negative transcriptional regulator [Gemmatimonas sp.]MCA2996717.1 FMN-binding negative transcriptional regulator [Gemmatimonas sp.]